MALSDATQIALGLLQTVGLLIPVVFLALQGYFEDMSDEQPRSAGSSYDDLVEEELDIAPTHIRLAWYIVGALVLAGIFASTKLLVVVSGSWLVTLSILSLAIGFVGLAALFYELRSSFSIPGV